jgi:hypothetical protein
MPTIYGPSADIDPGQAYLFQRDDNGLFAASRDPPAATFRETPARKASAAAGVALLASLSTTTKLATRRCFWHKPGGAVSWNARW